MEYAIIRSREQALPYVDRLLASKVMAVDLETTGLDPHRDRIRLIQLAVPDSPVMIFDCSSFLPLGADLMKTVLECPSVKVLHNAKFDMQFLFPLGIELPKVFDTMLAAQLLRSSGGPARAGLGAVAAHYLGETLDKAEQKGDWEASELRKEQLEYAAKDAEVLLRLREEMRPLIYQNRLERIAKIEFDCVKAIAKLEYNGIYLDSARWQELCVEAEKAQAQALEQLRAYAGQSFYQLTLWGDEIALNAANFDSNPFVLSLLKRNGINVPSTDRRHLSAYAAHPLVQALSEYRKSTKALSAFLHPIPSFINPATGRLHPKYGQIGASSGRMSCGNPNIQQIPREPAFRRCFCAPPGKKLIIADYSQIELRVAACISKDRRMMQAYRNGEDLHALTASLLSGVPAGSVTKAQRQAAKAVNFGLIFGMGAAGLAAYAQQSYGVQMTLEEAEQFRNGFFRAYPGIARWHRQIRELSPTEERTLTGRKFVFRKNAGLSGLCNTPVQGSAADIAKAALGELNNRLIGTGIKLIAIVHDEILLEADEADAAAAAALLQSTMERAGERILQDIPCAAEVKIADDWSGK